MSLCSRLNEIDNFAIDDWLIDAAANVADDDVEKSTEK